MAQVFEKKLVEYHYLCNSISVAFLSVQFVSLKKRKDGKHREKRQNKKKT